ncbi:multidrug resistance protein fnx1 [Aaosphaeria arxii CBS 175.79]|uniref:Efflux pump dotC n=1 Tax=Aaosphaeria arxii CBS 175.79 TaxID=1450172 RepID=A0A6A5XAL8_9PLEO|nr:multidrug resistance protein fnx1 [Aaosphaeria arxii CBS 175.79]KAF2009827.1 multidrug resistance protein fnx1 [Aaosphaeria arxii CBS 175.79]
MNIHPQPPASNTTSQSTFDKAPVDSAEPLTVNEKIREDASHGANSHLPTDAPGPDDEKPKRSKLKITLIMLSLGISVLLVALDITIVTTALPTIAEHFNSASGYTWVGSAYLISNSAATPIWGKVSDIFGRKPILLVTNAIFFIGSLLAAVSVNMNMLIASRVIQGIGGGGLIVLVNICISDLFAMRERGAYFGIIGGVWALASSLGPVVGGAFTQKVSWRWCFYINLPLDGVAFAIVLFCLDLHTPKTPLGKGLKAVDWLGSFTMVSGTIMLLLGLEFGGVSFPWSSATVICLIVFGAITIGLFFIIEYRFAPSPLMPLHVFSQRSNLAALGTCFFHAYVFISASYFLPLYFQAVLGATPILSGVYLLPTAISLSFLSAFTGIFIRKTGQYLPCIWFGFIFMTIGFGLFIDLGPRSSWAKIIIYQIIGGIGVGPNFQSPLIALQSLVPKRDVATATSTFGFVRNLGSAISIVVGSVIFQNRIETYQPLLRSTLPPQVADAFGAGSAGASVGLIKSLPDNEKAVARYAFSKSLSTMWIMYVCFSAAGLAVSLLITKNVLQKQHEETKTGLEEEKARRLEREQAKAEKRRKKSNQANLPTDVEAASDPALAEKKDPVV